MNHAFFFFKSIVSPPPWIYSCAKLWQRFEGEWIGRFPRGRDVDESFARALDVAPFSNPRDIASLYKVTLHIIHYIIQSNNMCISHARRDANVCRTIDMRGIKKKKKNRMDQWHRRVAILFQMHSKRIEWKEKKNG